MNDQTKEKLFISVALVVVLILLLFVAIIGPCLMYVLHKKVYRITIFSYKIL